MRTLTLHTLCAAIALALLATAAQAADEGGEIGNGVQGNSPAATATGTAQPVPGNCDRCFP